MNLRIFNNHQQQQQQQPEQPHGHAQGQGHGHKQKHRHGAKINFDADNAEHAREYVNFKENLTEFSRDVGNILLLYIFLKYVNVAMDSVLLLLFILSFFALTFCKNHYFG